MSILSFGDRVARSAWRMTPQRALSDVIGWGANRSFPASLRASVIRSFARQYQINLDEAEKPVEEYSGLQEFFTRRLKPSARPIAGGADQVAAPADGTVVEGGLVREGLLIDAKDAGFTLADLIGDASAAAELEGGPYLVTYLSPQDYHRVHSPVSGRVLGWQHIPGRLFPVNSRSVVREPGLFSKNERFVTVIDGEAGLCAVVMVAAVGVGHMTASYDAEVATHQEGFSEGRMRSKRFVEQVHLARGAELGIFNLGSTTIVVFQKDRVELSPLAPGSRTRMGEAMGRIVRRA